jgi:predicted ATPase/DNA-binding SARP family transcriptional activator
MSNLTVSFLGSPLVELDGVRVELKLRKVLALLVFLAVTGQRRSRDELADLLYPLQNRERSRCGIRQALCLLRGAIGGHLGSDRSNLWLEAGPDVRVDTQVFRQLSAAAGEAQRTVNELRAEQLFEEAAGLVRGEFLAGFYLRDSTGFEQWQEGERQSLAREHAAALRHLAAAHEHRGEWQAAIGWTRRRLAVEPLEESSHRDLMRLLARSGERAAALRQYERCRELLRRDLGEAPSRETEDVRRLIAAGGGEGPPTSEGVTEARPAGIPRPGRLPKPPTSFIGRKAELARALQLLCSPEMRLLTLTGAGGTGKTRLAVEAASRLEKRFTEGAFFVDLAPLGDPEQVVPAIAAALGVRVTAAEGRSLLAALEEALGDRKLLLLLDNCEHLLAAATQIAGLLSTCPRVKILATSRERLRLRGERELIVPPLRVPQRSIGAARLHDNEAVRLFLDRVAAVRPDFRVTKNNGPVVADICRRLDGLPLGIELAAAMIRTFSAEDLLRRLENRLLTFSGGPRDLPVRQQTLHNTLEWSHTLLTDAERRLFAMLSLFVGGCTLDAVESVCVEAGRQSETETFACLASLADKNLLVRDERGGETRFTMLETVHEYARERLAALTDAELPRERHARFFLRLAQKAEPLLHGGDQAVWQRRITRELDNLRAAMGWFLATGRAVEGLRLASALELYWFRTGLFNDGREWLEAALRLRESPAAECAVALRVLGFVLYQHGEWSAACTTLERSRELCREVGRKADEALALVFQSVSERALGDAAIASAHAEEAVRIARETTDPWHLALTLVFAYATTGGAFIGRPPVAELEEAVRILRQAGATGGIAQAQDGLGDLSRQLGRLDVARRFYGEALEQFRELGDPWTSAWALEGLGSIAFLTGELLSAEAYFKESIGLFASLGDTGTTVSLLQKLGMLARARGDHRRAAMLLAAFVTLHEVSAGGEGARHPERPRELTTALAEYRTVQEESWMAGRTMSLARAVENAVADRDGEHR